MHSGLSKDDVLAALRRSTATGQPSQSVSQQRAFERIGEAISRVLEVRLEPLDEPPDAIVDTG
jgi:hypothetical protein